MRPSDITDGISAGTAYRSGHPHKGFNEAVGYYRRNRPAPPGVLVLLAEGFNEAVGYYRRNQSAEVLAWTRETIAVLQ